MQPNDMILIKISLRTASTELPPLQLLHLSTVSLRRHAFRKLIPLLRSSFPSVLAKPRHFPKEKRRKKDDFGLFFVVFHGFLMNFVQFPWW